MNVKPRSEQAVNLAAAFGSEKQAGPEAHPPDWRTMSIHIKK